MIEPKRKTLYQRIFVPFGIAIVVTAALTWLASSLLLGQFLERSVSERMHYTLELIATKQLPMTPDLLRRISQFQRMELTLINTNGQVSFTSLPRSEDRDSQLAQLWQADRVENAFVTTHAGHRFLALVRPIEQPSFGGHSGIMIFSSLQGERDAVKTAALGIALLTLVIVGILAWLGHRMSQAITRPIGALANMATQIATGDRTVRVQSSSISELATLTESLNSMAERLEEYERQLATKNRLATLGELAERVAHEIRNPITAIKLHMQILAERLAGGDLEHIPKQLLVEIDRLDLVVSNTLALGKPMSIEPAPAQIEQVISAVVTLLRPSLVHRGIDLQWQSPSHFPAITLDANRFKQVVYNLLTNAADALDGSGIVRIIARENPDAATITVAFEDSGPGFSNTAKTNFANRLSQSGKPNGSGVGLLLSLELIELHGGSLTLGASADLQGGLALIQLPIRSPSKPQQPTKFLT